MASCCRGNVCEQVFTSKVARRDLRRYRSKGLNKIERRMLQAASRGGVEGARVLEIGGGIGTLQTELLAAGADTGEIIEVTSSYEPYARELAAANGLTGRTTFRILDLLEEPDQVAPADVVLLNGVLCCSPDGLELATAAAKLTRGTIVFSYARRTLMARLFLGVGNLMLRLTGRTYQVHLRRTENIVAAAEAGGPRLFESGHTWAWEYVAFSV